MRAFERFPEVGASPTAPGWLKTVTTNLCLNHLSRYRARWQFFNCLR
jgi:RNA polymerase sigma-70 factor (ECF subfamily)